MAIPTQLKLGVNLIISIKLYFMSYLCGQFQILRFAASCNKLTPPCNFGRKVILTCGIQQLKSMFEFLETITKKILLILVFTALSLGIYAQKKEIKVQIIHDNEIVLDTTLYKTSAEANLVITNLVERFSTQKVTIDTKITHGLYVFNITNDSWKKPSVGHAEKAIAVTDNNNEDKTAKTAQKNYNPNSNNIDSLFREFSDKLEAQWQMANIEVFIDSLGSSFNTFKSDVSNFDFENNPDIQNIKSGFLDLFEKIRTTKIVIIQDGDTIKTD